MADTNHLSLNTFDYFIFGWCAYLALKGWRQGFLRSFVAPLSFCLALACGYHYYQNTHQLIGLIATIFLGKIVISIALSFMLSLFFGKNSPPSPSSQAMGSLLSLSWGVLMVLSILLSFSLIKPSSFPFDNMIKPLFSSGSFLFVEKNIKPQLPFFQKTEKILAISKDPEKIEELQKQPGFKKFYEDKKIQEVVNNPEIQDLIKNKETFKLLNHPKITALLEDPKTAKKFQEFYSSIKTSE